jgi:hypothetical protein
MGKENAVNKNVLKYFKTLWIILDYKNIRLYFHFSWSWHYLSSIMNQSSLTGNLFVGSILTISLLSTGYLENSGMNFLRFWE